MILMVSKEIGSARGGGRLITREGEEGFSGERGGEFERGDYSARRTIPIIDILSPSVLLARLLTRRRAIRIRKKYSRINSHR